MRRIVLIGIALAGLSPSIAAADGCDRFAWSVSRAQGLMNASDKATIAIGETLATLPKAAIILRLKPPEHTGFQMPPERKPKIERWFGGAVKLPALERAGIYQVTLSEEAWVDVIQDGRYARSVGSSGRSDCPGVRKSLRLELSAAPITLQVSGVATEEIVLTFSPAE